MPTGESRSLSAITFGTKEGEPTFRITMCLARLLEDDPKARQELKLKLGQIYKLRSKIVNIHVPGA